ncbi:MAG TPA: methyltransferase [Pseudomonadota bacterium]|nr:methyltransferase [Pseudomonadota bacterium]
MNILVDLAKKLDIVPAPQVDTVSCVLRARAIIEANRLGVFQALESGPLTAEEVAAQKGLSLDGTRALLAALVACDYLKERGGRFENGRWVTKWILDSGMGLGHFLGVQENVWDRASTLGECVRTGRPVKNPHEALGAEAQREAEVYVRGMKQMSQFLIPHMEQAITLPAGARRLLDLGGSHGDYARALVRRHPGLQATVLDLEGVAIAAEKISRQLGDTPPVEYKAGNLLADDLGTSWDAALMISVLHVFNTDQARLIFKKVAAALAPGGVFAILDHMRGVSRGRDSVVAMMGLNWLTLGGRSYTLDEVTELLTTAGFSKVTVRKLSARVGATVVMGSR